MKTKAIYLDNAATSWPKPEPVYLAQDEYSRRAANPGRGAHKPALDSARMIFETRTSIAELLGVKQAERLVFTPSCTHSINLALQGLPWNEGDTIVTSSMEHNAVMRPLEALRKSHGVNIIPIAYARKGVIDMHAFIKTLLDLQPKLCVFSEASNVTGELIDLTAVATICSAHKVPLMVDAAQTAGRTFARIDQLGISIWCASGHKGLLGLPGVGLLYVAPNLELKPLIVGGTGSKSEELQMPDAYPDHLEAGTLPGPAIAALGAGVKWLREKGLKTVSDTEQMLTKHFLEWAQRTGVVRVYGNRTEGAGIAVVAFDIEGLPCDRVAAVLDSDYNISVRTGLHCSPSAHRALGTLEGGLLRASFSSFNAIADVDAFCNALASIKARKDISAPV